MKLTKRRWGVIIGAVVVLALSAYALAPEPQMVETVAANRGPLTVSVSSQGVTRVRERFDVAAPVAGQLLRVNVHAGDDVDETTPIVRIQPAPLDPKQQAQLEARLQGAERGRDESEAFVRRAAAAHLQARRDTERLRRLSADAIVSREALEQAASAEAMAAKELEAARFRAQASAFEVDVARAALGAIGTNAEITLCSPVRGTILRVHHESESVVQAGTPIVQVGDPRSLEAVADFLSADAVKVKAGDEAFIEAWGGGTPIRARVRLVEPSGFMKVSALGVEEQRVNVIADPLEIPQSLGDQFRVDVRVTIWSGQALKVPSTAIFTSKEGWNVFAIRGSRARVQPVTLGHAGEDDVEVLTGIAEGDRVVAHPSDEVRDGVRVRTRRSG
jgi:HlyD family secretion protein